MGRNDNRILGAALVGIGLLMLLGQMGLSALSWAWPIALLIIGVAILVHHFRSKEDAGQIFTGSLLVLLAFFFQLNRFGVLTMESHWPFLVLAPGIALLVMARLDARRRDAMVPGWIAIGVAAVLYFFSLGVFVKLLELVFGLLGVILKIVVPLGLIGLGAWMVFNQRAQSESSNDFPEKVEPSTPGPESEPELEPEAEESADDEPAETEVASSEPEIVEAEFETIDEPTEDSAVDDALAESPDNSSDEPADDPDEEKPRD